MVDLDPNKICGVKYTQSHRESEFLKHVYSER